MTNRKYELWRINVCMTLIFNNTNVCKSILCTISHANKQPNSSVENVTQRGLLLVCCPVDIKHLI